MVKPEPTVADPDAFKLLYTTAARAAPAAAIASPSRMSSLIREGIDEFPNQAIHK